MAVGGTAGDPRLDPAVRETGDIRPIVRRGSSGPSAVVIAAGLAIFAALLFYLLESRRQAMQAPAVRTGAVDRAAQPAREVPPLHVPPALHEAPAAPPPGGSAPVQMILPVPPQGPPRVVYVPQPAPPQPYPQPPMAMPAEMPQIPRGASEPVLVIDNSSSPAGGAPASATADGGAAPVGVSTATARAAPALVNRSTTVPQGTLIPAVLETGFDSTRPGFARAIVSRDVRGFDGTRVLIPRGSRLIGDYGGGAEAGQKRAAINWTRLVRPDGVAIDIGSPAADPVGRVGIRAKVNTHFWERFGGAILQSVLDIGVNVASRAADGSVVLAIPGGNGGSGGALNQGEAPKPTLTVRPGTSIAVFVARDLDFSGVGNRQ